MIRWKIITSFLLIFHLANSQTENANLFSIEKDSTKPWSQVQVNIPNRHPLYKSFHATVEDLSTLLSEEFRDGNKSFTSSENGSPIRIHGLKPGHRYSISVFGQNEGSSSLIKEETLVMDPKAPDFHAAGSEIMVQETNATLRTTKNESSLQDSFTIEYRQVNPDRKFPVLRIQDIPDQKTLEFYLGNLNPGHDYVVRVTAMKEGLSSQPWTTTLTTKPSPLVMLTVDQNSSSCIDVQWKMEKATSSDFVIIQYAMTSKPDKISNMTVSSTEKKMIICDATVAGEEYTFIGIVQKGDQQSDKFTYNLRLRPLPPIDFRVRADLKRGKYKLLSELPAASKIDKCRTTVQGENSEKTSDEADVEQTKSGHKICWFNFALTPGERYDFALASVSNEVASQKVQKSIVLTPAFDFNAFGLAIQENNEGLEVLWPQSEVFIARVRDIWNKVVGTDSSLNVRVSYLGGNSTEKPMLYKSNPKQAEKILIKNLAKGACYRIQVYTVTKTGIISDVQHNETLRLSSPAVNISLDTVTKSSTVLKLTYTPQEKQLADCQIHVIVRDMHSQIVFDRRLPVTNAQPPLLTLEGLRPFHKYTVNTQIVCGGGSNACAPSTRTMRQISFATRQDRPGPVQNLKVEPLNAYSSLISWLPPSLPNGILTHYVVNITRSGSDAIRTVDVGASSNRSDHTIQVVIDELKGGEKYKISVLAANEAGLGDDIPEFVPSIQMPIMAPPKPQVIPQIAKDSIGSAGVLLRFPSSIFDNRNGEVKQYAVIVSEVPEESQPGVLAGYENVTLTWLQVQRFETWPSYIAKMKNAEPFSDDSTVIFEDIGEDENCHDLKPESVCNGPLKPSTKYRLKVRLYTAPNLYTDTNVSAVFKTQPLTRGLPLPSLIAVLAVVSFSGFVATLLLYYWTRSKKTRCDSFDSNASKEKESQWAALKMMMAERAADCLAKLGLDANQTTTDHADTSAHLAPGFGQHRRTRSLRERTGVEHRLERLPSGPMNRTPLYTVMTGVNTNKTRPVRIVDFPEHYRMMSADSEFRFSEEYEVMRNFGSGQSHHAAELAINRPKNRFTNILPYDHSRVRLSNPMDQEGGDYINANFIPGFSSRKEFIAAQGPLPHTRDHFWQMTWEQGCPVILALTKCVEKGRDKCHQYWPDNECVPTEYGQITVTVVSEKHYDEFVIRELLLENTAENKSRTIQHWHYMAWPDFGVPQHPRGIISFAQLYRHYLPHSPQNKPTIVHCSAGVGRSGTFMAIDRLLQHIQLQRPIDVFGIVTEMRFERCQMVQNEQQYVFIHQCILHALQNNSQLSPAINGSHTNRSFFDDATLAESGF